LFTTEFSHQINLPDESQLASQYSIVLNHKFDN
jgi:hypothetical protein